MGRYWGNRAKAEPEEWQNAASKHLGKEILIVDTAGTVLYRGPVYDPVKAQAQRP
jgi:hypothetical protein